MNRLDSKHKSLSAGRVGFASLALLAACQIPLAAQDVEEVPEAPSTTQPADGLVTLNFPEDTPLGAFIAYVSERLSVNFLYDEGIAGQLINLRGSAPVRQDELLDVLSNVLQTKSLILEDTSVPTIKRIIPAHMTMTAPGMEKEGVAPRDVHMITQFFSTRNVRAEQLVPLVQPMLSKPGGRCLSLPDKQALVVTDYPVNIQRIREFIQVANSPTDHPEIRTVPVFYGEAAHVAQTLLGLVQNESASTGWPNVVVVPDELSNQIVLSGPPATVDRLVKLVAKLDLTPNMQQTTRFYRLTNSVAADVLSTLRALEGQESPNRQDMGQSRRSRRNSGIPEFGRPLSDSSSPPEAPSEVAPVEAQASGEPAEDGSPANRKVPKPTIVADDKSNSVIIIATPRQHENYKSIIQELDQRRPQVMIETTVVALDTSKGFSLGVDTAARHNGGKIISFSSFGISEVDAPSGSLTPVDAPGGTLALLNPDVADIVIRALSTNSRSRLVSMPRVLVNDNGTGKLQSVQSEPFQRTVISQDTVIVGEGSNAEAGTTIEVTPHISNGNYLQLEYSVELSSFTGEPRPNLPPPSQKSIVESEVTIPDGHTIIVGGLNRTSFREGIDSIPFLGDIPLLKYLFRSQNKTESNTTLFVFIRPTILRDDVFRDLKYLSAIDRKAAKVADDLPPSEPLTIRSVQ